MVTNKNPSQAVTKELAKWGVLLNIRAVKNLFVSSKFSASLFYQLKFSQAREIDK